MINRPDTNAQRLTEVVAIQLGGVAFNSILGYGVSNFSILVVL